MDVYKDRADMITVYIEEAHAADEWFVHNKDNDDPISFVCFFRPIGSQICYVQPKCDEDRIRIANDFIQSTGYLIPLLIDPVSTNHPFSTEYCPWPIRFYIINSMKKLSYIAQPIEGSYPLEMITDALDASIQQCQSNVQ